MQTSVWLDVGLSLGIERESSVLQLVWMLVSSFSREVLQASFQGCRYLHSGKLRSQCIYVSKDLKSSLEGVVWKKSCHCKIVKESYLLWSLLINDALWVLNNRTAIHFSFAILQTALNKLPFWQVSYLFLRWSLGTVDNFANCR